MTTNLAHIIEALLFVAGEPLSVVTLAEHTKKSAREVEDALRALESLLESRGVRLLRKDDEVTLVTAPEAGEYIEQFIKEEILGELSKAALETITIIAYRHPISRAEIDYIRGVNSSFTLRALLARGLVERAEETGSRRYQYQPTLAFMKFLGLRRMEDLPEYKEFRKELETTVKDLYDAT